MPAIEISDQQKIGLMKTQTRNSKNQILSQASNALV